MLFREMKSHDFVTGLSAFFLYIYIFALHDAVVFAPAAGSRDTNGREVSCARIAHIYFRHIRTRVQHENCAGRTQCGMQKKALMRAPARKPNRFGGGGDDDGRCRVHSSVWHLIYSWEPPRTGQNIGWCVGCCGAERKRYAISVDKLTRIS